jgi:RNA polymerase primary sigma factor
MSREHHNEARKLREYVTKESLDHLPKAEERALFERLAKALKEKDDSSAKAIQEMIVRMNLRFCFAVAMRMGSATKAMSLGEVFSSAVVGLNKAIQKFDPSKDVKFISYAIWWIKQQIKVDQALFEYEVRVPMNIVYDISVYRRKFKKEIEEGLMPPDHPDFQNYVPLLVKGENGDEVESLPYIGAILDDENHQDAISRSRDVYDIVQKTLASLPEREARILRYAFGIDTEYEMTLAEIGAKVGVTRERVRQIRDQALRRIHKNFFRNAHLNDIIGD